MVASQAQGEVKIPATANAEHDSAAELGGGEGGGSATAAVHLRDQQPPVPGGQGLLGGGVCGGGDAKNEHVCGFQPADTHLGFVQARGCALPGSFRCFVVLSHPLHPVPSTALCMHGNVLFLNAHTLVEAHQVSSE